MKKCKIYLVIIAALATITFLACEDLAELVHGPKPIPTFTVTFNSNGATSGDVPETQTVNENTVITIPDEGNLIKTDNIFFGWTENGVTYNAGDTYKVTKNTIFTAKWIDPSKTPPCTVTFDGNGATSGSAPNPQTTYSGENIIIPNQGTLAKDNKTFGGWNTEPDGSGANYTAGASYKVNGNITLYAKWQDTVVINLEKVSIAAIPGVTAPLTGRTPVTAINENYQYTGTVTWSPNDSVFAASTAYTATITLTARYGYTLQGVGANFFTVAEATSVNNAANSGVITAVFPQTGGPTANYYGTYRTTYSNFDNTRTTTETIVITDHQIRISDNSSTDVVPDFLLFAIEGEWEKLTSIPASVAAANPPPIHDYTIGYKITGKITEAKPNGLPGPYPYVYGSTTCPGMDYYDINNTVVYCYLYFTDEDDPEDVWLMKSCFFKAGVLPDRQQNPIAREYWFLD